MKKMLGGVLVVAVILGLKMCGSQTEKAPTFEGDRSEDQVRER